MRFICVLLWLAALQPGSAFSAAQEPLDPFEAGQRLYYREKLDDVTRELIVQEKLLAARLVSITEELRRRGLDPRALSLDLDPLLREAAPSLETLDKDEADFRARVQYWIQRQRELLIFKQMQAVGVRERLIASPSPAQLQAMFQFELERAVKTYATGDFRLAALLFGDLLEGFPYSNLDDVLFFQAEAEFADGAYDSASRLYRRLLREFPVSEYRLPAFRHLIYIRAMYDQHVIAIDECAEFDWRAFIGDPETAYLCGLEFYRVQRFAEAREILGGLPREDVHYFRALHLVGLSLILENDFDAAIEVFEELLELPRKGIVKDVNKALREDARLKLGYLYFEADDFGRAAEMFESIDKGGALHAQALLGRAWSSMSLADHEQAFEHAVQMVEHYPDSPYRYEAQTLAGYASERMQNREQANLYYEGVLAEAERGESLRNLAQERREIQRMLRRLVAQEMEVFEGGLRESFGEYMELKRKVRTLMKRIKYTELQTANESMAEFIVERQQVIHLLKRLKELTDIDRRAVDEQTRREIAALHRQVRSLLNRIRLAGFVEIQRQPLMLYESTAQAASTMLDSLALASTRELAQLQASRAESELLEGGVATPGDQLTLALQRHRVETLTDELEHLRHEASTMSRPSAGSNLERWSELAFSRLAIGDIRFDELERIEDRIGELDGYIDSIDELLEGGTTGESRTIPVEDPAAEEAPEEAPIESPAEDPAAEEAPGESPAEEVAPGAEEPPREDEQ